MTKQVKVIIEKDGKYLLVKRADKEKKEHKGNWECPGGKLNENESFEDAAIRESKEETNLDIEIKEKSQLVINYSADWADLWTDMFPTEMIASAIQFDKSVVIAVFAGEKNTGGYDIDDIEITKIMEKPGSLEVYIKETSPGQSCATTQALTQPYHIVEMPRINKPVNFIIQNEVRGC